MKKIILATTLLAAMNCVAQKNLIKNGSFNEGNTGFETQYRFVPFGTNCEGAGEIIINSDAHILREQWDGKGINGNYMMVDGYTEGNVYFWRQKITVQKKKHYLLKFSTQTIADPNYYSRAKIGLYINDKRIALFITPEAYQKWHNNELYISSETNTVLDIQLKVENPQWSGNDFGIDEMSLSLSNKKKKLAENPFELNNSDDNTEVKTIEYATQEGVKDEAPPPPIDEGVSMRTQDRPEEKIAVKEEVTAPKIQKEIFKTPEWEYTSSNLQETITLTNTGKERLLLYIYDDSYATYFQNVEIMPGKKLSFLYNLKNKKGQLHFVNYSVPGIIKVTIGTKPYTLSFTTSVNRHLINIKR